MKEGLHLVEQLPDPLTSLKVRVYMYLCCRLVEGMYSYCITSIVKFKPRKCAAAVKTRSPFSSQKLKLWKSRTCGIVYSWVGEMCSDYP